MLLRPLVTPPPIGLLDGAPVRGAGSELAEGETGPAAQALLAVK